VLQALYMAASAGGFAHLADADFIFDCRVVGGLQSVPLRLAERAQEAGAEIRLGTPVERIEWGGTVVVHAGGTQVRTQRVLIATPPTVVRRIGFVPPLPPLLSNGASTSRSAR
jgi:putrescine oxidase